MLFALIGLGEGILLGFFFLLIEALNEGEFFIPKKEENGEE